MVFPFFERVTKIFLGILSQAVGYSCLPKTKNEDGLVVVVFAKKMADVTTYQQQIVDTFQKLLGSKPNLTVCVDSVRELPSDKYVLHRAGTF